MTTIQPTFRLIPGEGKEKNSPPRGELTAVEQHTCSAEQLNFRFWTAPSQSGRLLSVGIDGLTFSTFRTLLAEGGVNFIVDVRNLASFRGRGFSARAFESALCELGVHYERFHELTNPFQGSSQNLHIVLRRYSDSLEERSDVIFPRLLEWLNRGTVLLLGRGSSHFGTERQVVVEQLARYRSSVEVLTFGCQGAGMVQWSNLRMESRVEPKAKSRVIERKTSKQLGFRNLLGHEE